MAKQSNISGPSFNVEDGVLVIRVPMTEPRDSSTGSTRIVASTGGFTNSGLVLDGHPVRVNVTATIPPTNPKPKVAKAAK